MIKDKPEAIVFEEPPLAKLLFADTRLACLWLPLRLFLGWEWLDAGLSALSIREEDTTSKVFPWGSIGSQSGILRGAQRQ
jgi:hypothetical protein